MLLDSTPSASDHEHDTVLDVRGDNSFLDRYEILSLIGEGGCGVVYKARHAMIGRTVAIKFLHEPAPDSVAMRRFQVEAQAAASLTHPNIVTVYDFGMGADNQLYLIMDFIEGSSLYEAIGDTEHLEVERAINIFVQACEALEHAHRRGIIHRDLKPSNIMLADDEYEGDFVKIVDFGLAKLMTGDGQNEKLTQTGELLGTPLYMSPEQCRGEPLDQRSDIYSLGCIMYRVLSGQQPILGKNALSTLYQHISKDPEPFAAAAPEIEIPRALELVVFKALEKDPADRYQSMAQLAADLRNVRKALSHNKGTVGWRGSVGAVLGHRGSVWAAAALMVVLAAAIGLVSSSQFWSNAARTTPAASQTLKEKPPPRPIAKSPDRKQATGRPVMSRARIEAPRRGSTSHPHPGDSEAYDSRPPEVAPPRVAPDRYAKNTSTAGSGAGAYDGSTYFADSAGEPAQGYASSSSPSAPGRLRGKKGNKRARLAETIGSVAEELLSDSASGAGAAGHGLGRKVGRYGRFLKDLVDDH